MLVAPPRTAVRLSGNFAERGRTKRARKDVEKRKEEERSEDASRLAVRLLEALDHFAEIRIVLHQLLDLLDGVHDRRMVLFVEQSSDLRIREAGQSPTEIHRDLSRKSDRFRVGLRLQI